MPLLDVKNLCASPGGKSILRNISFSLAKGQRAGLLGPNGSGKTTLIKCLSGVLKPSSGNVFLCGKNLATLSARARGQRMAVVPQNSRRPEGLTVLRLALLGRYPWLPWLGFFSDRDYDFAKAALEKVDLREFQDRRLETLSGGEWQRTMLARAITQVSGQDEAIMLLDEFAAGLDMFRCIELFNLLQKESSSRMGILMVLHDCNLAAIYANWLIGLKNGQILFQGETNQVFTGENLSELYDMPVGIYPHPDLGVPQAYAHFFKSGACYGAGRGQCPGGA